MQNSPIFYVVHGQFFEKSNENKKNPKKIVRIHKLYTGENPKKLRKKALRFFEKIRDENLVKNNADCPPYKIYSKNEVGRYRSDFDDSIQNVPFTVNSNKKEFEIALTLSFGIFTSRSRINQNQYNKFLYPIAVIGKSLHEVEDCLKVNLVLEKHQYEKYNFSMPKHIENYCFLDKNIIANYMLGERFFSSDIHLLQQESKKVGHSYFRTPQFYKVGTLSNYNELDSLGFLERFEKREQLATQNKLAIYKKELENLSHHFSILEGRTIDLSKYPSKNIYRKLNRYRLKSFFTKKQNEIFNEIENNSFTVRELLSKIL